MNLILGPLSLGYLFSISPLISFGFWSSKCFDFICTDDINVEMAICRTQFTAISVLWYFNKTYYSVMQWASSITMAFRLSWKKPDVKHLHIPGVSAASGDVNTVMNAPSAILSAMPLSFRHSPTTVALIPIDVSLVTWSIIKDLSGDITSTVPKWSKCSYISGKCA